MAFDWFFKRKFRGNQGDDIFHHDDDDQGYVEKNKDEKFHDSFDVPFIDPFGTLEDTSHDIFQRMEDMLNQMFTSSFAALHAENFNDGIPNGSDPRAIMLRDPDDVNSFDFLPRNSRLEAEKPSLLVDSDIDDKVANLGSLWKNNPADNAQRKYSYNKSSSFRLQRLPDGSMEEHHIITDSQGNVTETTRRKIGEQCHEIITHSDANGLKEKQENYTNLDENDLLEFEKRWQNKRTNRIPAMDLYRKTPMEKPTPPTGDPSYLSLFKKFFGV